MVNQIYGLLGRKLQHSWSVPIHQAVGNHAYRLIEMEPDQVTNFLRRSDIGGLNVTIPYKRQVMPLCDHIDPFALEIGSVNTLVRHSNGKLLAWNTDITGFFFMARRAGIELQDRKVLILGSGGTSLTAQAAARALHARKVVVVSRSGENHYGNLAQHADAEILINTTPVGMYPNTGASPVDLQNFPACRGVLDVIYNPQRTALLLQAESLGIPCSDGLPMLVAQATASEERFFNCTISESENERILSKLRRESTNIVLIGMPGCGKSAVGKHLAELTGREVIDLDRNVVRAAGMSIPEIFARDGEAEFRRIEHAVVHQYGKESGKIIVTGGGIVKDTRNYDALHQNGRIYYLDRTLDRLDREGRPLSIGADLAAMATERAPMYARFQDAVIDNNGPVEETAEAIRRDFFQTFGN